MNLDPARTATQKRTVYWRSTQIFTMLLLLAWFLVTFGVIFFARTLSEVTLFGWTFSYYMAAQGTLFIYLIIVAAYAWCMPKFEKNLKGKDANDE
jgi:putative solute:sodium symporter small subunit